MRYSRILIVAAVTAAITPGLRAQGPDPELLPADTVFLAHFDLQRLARLVQVDELLDKVRDDPEQYDAEMPLEILEHVRQDWGFDPLRDIQSLTVFGSELPRDNPTVMIVTSDRLDGVLDRLRDANALRSVERDGVRFERLVPAAVASVLGFDDVDADDDHVGYLFIRSVGQRRAILIGEKSRHIAHAARVLSGEEPSAADGNSAILRGRRDDGLIGYAEVAVPLDELAGRSPASKIASKVRHLSLALAEDDGQVSFTLTAMTKSAADATAVAAIVNGLRGLISLAGSSDELEQIPKPLRDALREARAEARGDSVRVHLELSLDAVRRQIHPRSRRRIIR